MLKQFYVGFLHQVIRRKHFDVNLNINRISDGIYTGIPSIGFYKNVLYGGTLCSHVISAAYSEVPKNMFLHSLQLHFVYPGNVEDKIKYKVETIFEGRSFSKKSVIAEQNNKILSHCNISFKIEEKTTKFIYSRPFPSNVKHYSELEDFPIIFEQILDVIKDNKKLLKTYEESLHWFTSIPIKCRAANFDFSMFLNPTENTELDRWVKIEPDKLIDTSLPYAHHSLLGFISDNNMLSPILIKTPLVPIEFVTSLDHTLWIHSNHFDLNDWILFRNKCLHSANGLSLNYGELWSQDGRLLATIVQEALLRGKESK